MTVSNTKPTLRIGAVGAGRMGAIHIENMLGVRFVEVAAICTPFDHEIDWCKNTVPEATIYKDYDDLLKDKNVDAVWLSSPTSFHKEQVYKALKADKHVFCEKPLSMNPEDAWDVYNKALQYPHLKVACGFPRRFVPAFQEAAKRIKNGELGEILSMKLSSSDLYNGTEAFSNYIKVSGGIFVDCNIHDIDACLFLLGEDKLPQRAFATGSTKVYPHFAEYGDVDNAHGLVEFDDGFVCNIYGSRDNRHGHHTKAEIFGSKANLTLHGEPRLLSIDIHDHNGSRLMNAKDQMELFGEAYVTEIKGFRDWILFDEDAGFNLKDAAKAVSIGQSLQQSVRSRQIVDIKAPTK
ncbi:hypothetical protein TRICI_001577 [Trichomonascus ciferrii]|uniref:Gfo/Idh/MocA-like oxidoreductase N-terminal domain-containing protein n=1 Tax=Trichomonascus ciferrii TaxID=44093 RepID=A0A642VCC9_9ASCO|nr:hypothetical protein TRICI_001577 [Trichomonascus ciferrii]